MEDTVRAFGRATPVNEQTLQQQITTVRSRIEVLKLALPASTMDDRAFVAVGTELRSKSDELDVLKADLKRIRIEARAMASRFPRRDTKTRSILGRVLFRHASAARSESE